MASCNHDWTSWWYDRANCQETRRCEICNEREYRKRHDWTSWWDDPNSCTKSRRCEVCGEREYAVSHKGYSGRDCYSAARCFCGKTTSGSKRSHDWKYGSWTQNGSTGCRRSKECNWSDCDASSTETKSHSFNSADTCTDCGYKKPEPPKAPTPSITSWITGATETSISATAGISGAWTGSIISVTKDGRMLTSDRDQRSVSLGGLSPSTTYVVVLEIWNENSDVRKGSQSVRTKDTPKKPEIVSSSARDTTWQGIYMASVTATTNYATDYIVTLSNSTIGYSEKRTGHIGDGSFSVFFSNLRAGTTYNYKVEALNENGIDIKTGTVRIADREPLIDEMSIDAITKVSARVSVTLQDGVADVVEWYLNGELKSSGTSKLYTFTGLNPFTNYSVKVIVRNEYGSDSGADTFKTVMDVFGFDIGELAAGDDFSKLKASEWNRFMTVIKEVYRGQYGVLPSLPTFASGERLLASQYNTILTVLRKIEGCTNIPENVVAKQKIQAERHINGLVDSINRVIGG